jgi:hypothetical protein
MVHVFPGPPYYQGDLLTFEINAGGPVKEGEAEVTLQVDGGESHSVTGQWDQHFLRFQLDAQNLLVGEHQLAIRAEQGSTRIKQSYTLEIQPANQRPEQEQDPAWVSREIDCCTLYYITNTAAARDIETLAGVVQKAVDTVDDYPTVEVDEKLDVYFSDRMWFNGAFGGPGELFIVYTDRYYGPTVGHKGIDILVRHEMGHAVFPHFSFNEGLSLYVAGGHYNPQPIPKRAAAMLSLDYYPPGRGRDRQHEITYLYQAGIVNYIIDTYGWEKLRDFIEADNQDGGAFSDAARNTLFSETFGVTRDTFEENFLDWLRSQDPGHQVEDLELTIELQTVRRKYQDRYVPWPWFFMGYAEETFGRPEYLHLNIREPHTPAHAATEMLIADAQQALADDQYDQARTLIETLEHVVSTGRLDVPLAHEYGSVAQALAEKGYVVVSLELEDGEAYVQVAEAKSFPELESMTLYKANGLWLLDEALESEDGSSGD